MNPDTRAIAIQGRAEIIWGKAPEAVRQSLRAQGLSDSETSAIITASLHERRIEIRRLGFRDIVIACLTGLGTTLLVGVLLPFRHSTSRIWSVPIMLTAFAIWSLGRGLKRVVAARFIEGSITEME